MQRKEDLVALNRTQPGDWYVQRRCLKTRVTTEDSSGMVINREIVMAILLVIKHEITVIEQGKEIGKSRFRDLLCEFESTDMFCWKDEFENLIVNHWDKLRSITKAMVRKYQTEESHGSYNRFITAAETMHKLKVEMRDNE